MTGRVFLDDLQLILAGVFRQALYVVLVGISECLCSTDLDGSSMCIGICPVNTYEIAVLQCRIAAKLCPAFDISKVASDLSIFINSDIALE